MNCARFDLAHNKLMIRLDMHVHTRYSKDSLLSLEGLFSVCRRKGVDCVAITDHNTIKGALEFQKSFSLCPVKEELSNPASGIKVIVGEEIETKAGEIIGLFLKEEVAPGLSAGKTIANIKSQGGLVYLPHPFDPWRKALIDLKSIEPFWDEIDIIEVFNSRSLISSWNKQALELAREKRKAYGVGSDAHSEKEVGEALVEIEDFHSPAEFMAVLSRVKIIEKRKIPLTWRLLIKSINLLRCRR